SKDEILWRAYQANWIYWLIGVFTAFLTSFYMFRLLFLTFFGSYRGDADKPDHGHDAHGHGHGGIHESPKVMLVPLVILAVFSFVGGWIGTPGSMGGSNHFDKFLEPIFHTTSPGPANGHTTAGEIALPEQRTEGPEPQTSHKTELIFTGISVVAGLLGLALAGLLYWQRPELPQKIADGLGGLYHTVVNKYYIDELYAALFVKPLVDGSSKILWRGIDQQLIDGAIDNSADGAREISDAVRRMQSGSIRSYAGWIALGASFVIAYMIWMGTR
ncbi:MAG TPA: NADH-quinone oxidoreductase subunit L, partial [Terriglobales bacterium]